MANPALLLRRLPLAPVVAVMFGATAAALVAATPQWMLEGAASSTGLSAALEIARPPLGMTARLLFVLVAFLLVAALSAAIVTLIGRAIAGLSVRRQRDVSLAAFAEELPKEGGRRRPISADRELGAPLMSDEALATVQDVAPVQPEPVVSELVDPVQLESEQVDPEQVEPEQVEPEQVEPERVESSSVAAIASDALVPSDAAPEAEADVVPEALEVAEPVEEAPLVLEAPEPVEATPPQPETQTVEDLMVDDELLLDSPLLPDADPEATTAPAEPEPVEPIAAEAAEPSLDAPLEVAEFDLPAPPEDFAAVEGESSIDALIRRLEAGLARRGRPGAPDPSAPSAAPAPAAGPDTQPHGWMMPDQRANDDAEQAIGTLRTMAGR